MTQARRSPANDRCNVLIIGAGPAGLSLSLSLREAGLDVRMVERQDADTLADPPYDGREIALSLRSVAILEKMGVWQHIAAKDVANLRSAKVTDVHRDAELYFNPNAVGEDKLGCMVANSEIRRALYAEHLSRGEAELISNTKMVDLRTGSRGGSVSLADGRTIEADLIVAADSRFSAARSMAGIGACKHDFKKTMIVSKVRLQYPHRQVAWESFLPGGPLAILPLNDDQASVVQTLSPKEAERQMSLDIEQYLDEANQRIQHRYGDMAACSKRFAYPLVGVYANAFVRSGFALIGDAAVGMHPITAHGFNLGVQGQSILTDNILRALKRGRSAADPEALATYQGKHRRLSAGMYWSTLFIAELYARESLPARVVRSAFFDAGRLLSPTRRMIMKSLTQPLAAS